MYCIWISPLSHQLSLDPTFNLFLSSFILPIFLLELFQIFPSAILISAKQFCILGPDGLLPEVSTFLLSSLNCLNYLRYIIFSARKLGPLSLVKSFCPVNNVSAVVVSIIRYTTSDHLSTNNLHPKIEFMLLIYVIGSSELDHQKRIASKLATVTAPF